jgi:RHS repeat-associated protein
VVDQIGLPQALLDERGEPLWQASYEAYGFLTSERGSDSCPFRFPGQYHDRETGFHYNFYRHYDPRLAGYLAPDPIGLTGGSNFYIYPRNPLLWDDPFGLLCGRPHKGQMGEDAMDAHFVGLGYNKVGGHAGPQGIDGVYHNPNGFPPFIIGEAKFSSRPPASLGTTTHGGQQMSDHWIDSAIGQPSPPGTIAPNNRLDAALYPNQIINGQPLTGNYIRNVATNPNNPANNPGGSVQKQVFTLPYVGGILGPGSVTKSANYSPGSGATRF